MKRFVWMQCRLLQVFVLFAGSLLSCWGANFSGLQGKELSATSRPEDVIGGILGGILGPKVKQLDRQIQSVTVAADEERRLVVKVTLSGSADANLSGEVLDAHRKPQRLIQSQPATASASESEVELVFTLDDAQLQEPTLESGFLRLSVAPDLGFGNTAGLTKNIPGLARTFSMPKRWQKEIKPETVVIKIKPRPEGAAKLLAQQAGATAPQPGTMKPKPPETNRVTGVRPPTAPNTNRIVRTPQPTGSVTNRNPGSVLPPLRGVGPVVRTPQATTPPTNRVPPLILPGARGSGPIVRGPQPTAPKTNPIVRAPQPAKPNKESGTRSPTPTTPGIKFPFPMARDTGLLPNRLSPQSPAETAKPASMTAAPVTFKTTPALKLPAVSVAKNQETVMNRTALAVATLPSTATLLKLDSFKYGLNREVINKNGRGPGSYSIDLLEGTLSDIPLDREAVTRISPRVFQDQNPQSGIFYFLPQAFYLDWKPDQAYMGYSLRMLYSAARTEGAAGEVLFACRLNAGVDMRDIRLATELLQAYASRHPEVRFTELRPLPIDKPPEVSLSGGLQHQYNIASDKIAINAISDVLGETDVSWVTDPVTKENLQLALVEDVGISGTLALTPAGGGLTAQLIPVAIRLAHTGTFGEVPWMRGRRWRNQTPYPLRLRYLHALLIQNNVPTVYSWNLLATAVPPLAQVEFDASTVPSWLDSSAKRLWLEYVPVEDCQDCDDKVISAITGGVTSMGSSQITFHTIKPLADTGAYEIAVQVRSKYFDPRSRELQIKPVVLKEDDKDFTLGPIYLVNRQSGESVPDDPLFEYYLELGMPDGTVHRATHWLASDNLRVLIGRVQIEQALGLNSAATDSNSPSR